MATEKEVVEHAFRYCAMRDGKAVRVTEYFDTALIDRVLSRPPSKRPPSGARGRFHQAIARLVAHFERLELEKFGLGFILRRLRLLDLAEKLGNRALQIVASDRGRAGVCRIGEMCGIGDARPLFFGGDLAIKVADHAGEFGHHHFDLPNPAALFLELKALKPNKRVRDFIPAYSLANSTREDVAALGSRLRDGATMHEEGFSFLTSGDGVRGRDRRPGRSVLQAKEGVRLRASLALAVHLPGSLTIRAGRGRKIYFRSFNRAASPFKQPRNRESNESVRFAG